MNKNGEHKNKKKEATNKHTKKYFETFPSLTHGEQQDDPLMTTQTCIWV